MKKTLPYLRLLRANPLLAAAALSMVVWARVLIWILPFSALQKFSASNRAPTWRLKAADSHRQWRWARAVEAASALVPQATCLTQALATNLLLRVCGDHVPLKIGVMRDRDGTFKAHAWLEVAPGKILIGSLPDLQHFQKFELGQRTSS